MNIFEKNLNKLTKQELIDLCRIIKKSSDRKTEIIRNLEKKFCTCNKSDRVNYGKFDQCLDCGLPMSGWWKPESRCTCTEPRNFYGNGVVIICKSCGLPVVDRRPNIIKKAE